jgi:2-polyprenyl-3-methyl-5-hydroxy-6-metoxy-1,4-benzoquinol methylase
MLTEASTRNLPDAWSGALSVERAEAWIEERDRESPTLLVIEKHSQQPIGLVMLFAASTDGGAEVDLRIGYLFAEQAWGQGLATELVAGLADWARSQPSIRTLTGGVAPANPASARVLVKNGFETVAKSDDGEVTYQLSVDHGTEWDRYAAAWDQDEGARAYAAAAFDSLRITLASRTVSLGGAHVCDFGCGTGLLTERLAGTASRIDAVDASRKMLDVLQAKIDRHGWSNVTTSTEIPAPPAVYDLIVCSSVCSFLDDYPAAVRRLTSLLRPGGLFVQWDWERDDDAESDGLTRGEIRDALASAGLESIAVATGFDIRVDGQPMRPLMGHGQRHQ